MSKSLSKPRMKHVLNYVYDIRNKMQVSLDIMEREAKLAKCKSRQRFDKNTLDRTLQVGQLVLMYLPVEGKPMSSNLHGPYEVLEQRGPGNYLRDSGQKKKIVIVSYQHAETISYTVRTI